MWAVWAIVVPFLVAWGAVVTVRVRRHARQFRDVLRSPQGLCGSCGYDLRGGSARCPECGTVSRWTDD